MNLAQFFLTHIAKQGILCASHFFAHLSSLHSFLNMYAIIETGGKQVRVEPGSKIRVERLHAEVGENIQFDNVLLVADGAETVVGTPHVDDSPVCAKILEHGRGKKIRVIKLKRRKNYRRTYGHRQDYTELEILSIGSVAQEPQASDHTAAEAELTEE